MGARQSRRSVDITTTPKKEGLPAEGVVGDAAAPGDGKLEKIEEADAKPTTNGVAPHTEATPEDKDKDKDEATEKDKEKEDAPKVEEQPATVESPSTENPAEGAAEAATTPTEGTPASPTTATSPESKETKKKDKPKKKWSFRSISFGKKDKNKPVREDAPKNGDVAKETLAEGGEEAETAATASPAEEKSAVSSPTEKEQSEVPAAEAPATESTAPEEEKPAAASPPAAEPAAAASPPEEKKEEPSTPAPTPVPVEAKKVEEVEKEAEPANADNTCEVSRVEQAVVEASPPVEVSKSQSKPIAKAPSIIERKTSEEFPSSQFLPSSPPPTPIDPSPLQQAQQVAANASAIAEALKLPAEAALSQGHHFDCPPATQDLSGDVPTEHTDDNFPTTNDSATGEPREDGKLDGVEVVEEVGKKDCAVEDVVPAGKIDSDVKEEVCPRVSKDTVEGAGKIEGSVGEEVCQRVSKQVVEAVGEEVCQRVSKEMVAAPVQEEVVAVSSDKSQEGETIAENIVEGLVEAVTERTVEDLVIHTEEGPVPVSQDVVFQAKPAVVVPDSRVEEETPMETGEDVESEVSEDVCEQEVEFKVPKTPEGITSNEESLEVVEDVPPPLPASPIPMPKATTQMLSFMSSQIQDSPAIVDFIGSDNPASLVTEESNIEVVEPTKIEEPSSSPEEIPDYDVLEVVQNDSEAPLEDNSCPMSQKIEDLSNNPEEIPLQDSPQVEEISEIPDEEATSPTLQKIEDHSESQNCPEPPKVEDSSESQSDVEPTARSESREAEEPLADQTESQKPEEPLVEFQSESHDSESSRQIDELPAPAAHFEPEEPDFIQQVSQQESDLSCPLPPPAEEPESPASKNQTDEPRTASPALPNEPEAPTASSASPIPTDTTLLTPPRSPSPDSTDNLTRSTEANEQPTTVNALASSRPHEEEHHSLVDLDNRDHNTESLPLEDSPLSRDSELELKERLAQTEMQDYTSPKLLLGPASSHLSHGLQEKNDQSKVEAPVENNVVANDVGTTETSDEAPKSPPPAVPAETLAPTLGPAITEDVASVTKAIEEIDINEKAVAAAVNENIESAKSNEIIADMNHQNNMNE